MRRRSPVVAFRQHQALRGLKTEAVNFSRRQQKTSELLPPLDDTELRRLLERVGGVETGVGEPDDLRFRALRLQQERGEVGGVQRNANRAHDLAALLGDEVAGVFFKRMAERVIGGHEEPCIAAGLHQRTAGAVGKRAGVIGPVEAVGLTCIAAQTRGRSADHDIDLLHLLGEIVNREPRPTTWSAR